MEEELINSQTFDFDVVPAVSRGNVEKSGSRRHPHCGQRPTHVEPGARRLSKLETDGDEGRGGDI